MKFSNNKLFGDMYFFYILAINFTQDALKMFYLQMIRRRQAKAR